VDAEQPADGDQSDVLSAAAAASVKTEPGEAGVVPVTSGGDVVDRKALVRQRWHNAINKVRDQISQVRRENLLYTYTIQCSLVCSSVDFTF